MENKEFMFWTDAQQASERLTHTTILYGDEPLYVERISPSPNNRKPSTIRGLLTVQGKNIEVPLDDHRLHKYRKLPPLGWVNFMLHKGATYLDRRPRRTRQHGLSVDNVETYIITGGGKLQRGYSYDEIMRDKGYLLSCKGDYPELNEALAAIKPASSLAISSDYALFRDNDGLRWLFRRTQRVGMFSGMGSLILFSKYSFLKEEILEDATFNIKDIQEF